MATSSTDDCGEDGADGRIFGEEKMNKRASYFGMLSSITTELDFMLKDLKKNENFTPSSPKSPLNATKSRVSVYTDSNLSTSEPTNNTSEEKLVLQLPPKAASKTNPFASSSPPLPPRRRHNVSNVSDVVPPSPSSMKSILAEFSPTLEDNALTMRTRLVHSKPVWSLPATQRAAAIHYLQRQPVGTFVVRQARHKDKLSLSLQHPGTGKGSFIESYPIESALKGVKLCCEEMAYPSLDDLITHHLHTEGALPCRLALPMAIMAARNLREIQSLAVLEEEFWKSSHSKTAAVPTKQELKKLEQPDGRVDSIDSKYTQGFHPHQRQQTIGGDNERTQQKIGSESLLGDILDDRPGCPKPLVGEYGIITGPPVIYENAETEEKFLPRPWSSGAMKSFTLDDIRRKRDSNSDRLSSLRPTSESGRQDMRFSTASEYEMMTSSTEPRYPPPKCAPPPPPSGGESPLDVFNLSPSVPSKYSVPPSMANRNSGVQYSQPYDQPPLPRKKGASSLPSYGKPPPAQQQKHKTMPTGYGRPVPANQQHDPYQAPHPAVGSLNNWQQQCLPRPQSLANYSAPPPPVTSLGSSAAESPHSSVEYSAEQQMQNILQPTVTSTAESEEAGAWNALPEFDPLFQHTKSDYWRPNTRAAVVSTDPNILGDTGNYSPSGRRARAKTLGDMKIYSAVDSSKSNALADMRNLSKTLGDSRRCSSNTDSTDSDSLPGHLRYVYADLEESIQAMRLHIPSSLTISTTQLIGLDDDDNSSESEDEVMSPTPETVPVGFPHTENQNGNHLVRSHSLEDLDLERSREEEEKKEIIKRNKPSHVSRMIEFAKKGSRGATKKLRKSKKRPKRELDPIAEIHDVIIRVASHRTIGLGALVSSFISTQEEKCMTDKPDVVLRSIRQYMSGIKNYLLNRREPEIDEVIDRYFPQVIGDSELEGIIEGALHQCVLEPLKSDIGLSCLKEYKSNSTMELMDHNFMEAKAKAPEELGIKENYIPPEGRDLDEIRQLFSDLQEAFSPIKKLDLLLKIVSTIYNSVRDKKNGGREVTHSMGADDFLPMLIYVLVQCEMISIEIEADYMWGLLDPSMLSGEGGYYLTTLSSAICVLKQFEEETKTEMKGFLTVLVAASPDPTCLSLKTQPVLPGMTTAEVCRNLAHGMEISDDAAEAYRLYLLKDFDEILVGEDEHPLQIKTDEEASGVRGCRFGFRPQTAHVLWPQTSGML